MAFGMCSSLRIPNGKQTIPILQNDNPSRQVTEYDN